MKQVVVGIISRIKDTGESEYLLIRSKKDFGEFTGFYYPPGGHVEEGEQPVDALVREIQEELNLIIQPIAELAVTPGDVSDQTTYWWSCSIIGGVLAIKEDEIGDAGYFTQSEMTQLSIWPATKAFFEEHIFKTDSVE